MEIIMNVLFVKMKISKLINYSTNNVCLLSCQGTMVFSHRPHGIRKDHAKRSCHALRVTQLEPRSEILARVFNPKMHTFVKHAPI
jgi:hypothetical protein